MHRYIALVGLVLVVLAGGCGNDGDTRPAAGSEPADLSRLAVVGDSLSAGVQSGILVRETQEDGYAALVARQARADLPLPLLTVDGGVPRRVNPEVQPRNLAVPGARTRDALESRPSLPIDSLVDLILGLPGLSDGVSRSQVEWAEALDPTTTLLWIGSNDLLSAATNGDPERITPVADFTRDLDEIVGRLAAPGRSLVVANLPDVTTIAFLTPASEVIARTGLPGDAAAERLGVRPGDYLNPEGVLEAAEILAGTARGPLGDDRVLDLAEAAQVRAATNALNAAIETRAGRVGAAVVDIRALLARADADGIVVDGTRLTSAFGGGLFSRDGIHPSDTGYAVIANAFIDAINARFGNAIPRVDVAAVLRQDPDAP
jgi:lysophospholipase L1-like esterase